MIYPIDWLLNVKKAGLYNTSLSETDDNKETRSKDARKCIICEGGTMNDKPQPLSILF